MKASYKFVGDEAVIRGYIYDLSMDLFLFIIFLLKKICSSSRQVSTIAMQFSGLIKTPNYLVFI